MDIYTYIDTMDSLTLEQKEALKKDIQDLAKSVSEKVNFIKKEYGINMGVDVDLRIET